LSFVIGEAYAPEPAAHKVAGSRYVGMACRSVLRAAQWDR
jgi:hypothetical protein